MAVAHAAEKNSQDKENLSVAKSEMFEERGLAIDLVVVHK